MPSYRLLEEEKEQGTVVPRTMILVIADSRGLDESRETWRYHLGSILNERGVMIAYSGIVHANGRCQAVM